MTRFEFIVTVAYEGGIGQALNYFGRNIAPCSVGLPPAFVKAWADAYDIIGDLQATLNEWRTEVELETGSEDEIEEE